MEYAQRNPLPVPPGGAYEPIKATIDSVFDWQYALRKRNLLNLYEKGKTLAWNANDLDWSTDVDIERLVRQRVANGLAPMINSMLSPPVHLGDDEVIRMQLHLNAFMLSQFLHGEQGALLATAKIVQGVPWPRRSSTPPTRSPTRHATSRSTTADAVPAEHRTGRGWGGGRSLAARGSRSDSRGCGAPHLLARTPGRSA